MNPDIVSAARKGAIYGIIISFSAAAVIGIVALLSGEFGDTQSKILLTTVLFGAASITALCHLAIADRAMRVVAVVGLVASLTALATGSVLIWGEWFTSDIDGWVKAFGVSGIAAVSFAHANLLLRLSGRRRRVIRVGLIVTLIAIVVVAVMLWLPILTNGEIPGIDNESWYWRSFGVVAIIDVLGTVVVPVLAIFLRDQPAQRERGATGAADIDALVMSVPGAYAMILQERADAAGVPVEAIALEALRRGIAAEPELPER
jgi:hypothetical protein